MIGKSEENRDRERYGGKKRDPRQFFYLGRKKLNKNKYIRRSKVVKPEKIISLFYENEIDKIKNVGKKRINKEMNRKIELLHVWLPEIIRKMSMFH